MRILFLLLLLLFWLMFMMFMSSINGDGGIFRAQSHRDLWDMVKTLTEKTKNKIIKNNLSTQKEEHVAIRGEKQPKDENGDAYFKEIEGKMSENQATEGETSSNAKINLPNCYYIELTM